MGWNLRYTSHLGIGATDGPLFPHSVGSADPLAQIRYAAEPGFSGISDNNAVDRPAALLDRMGDELARLGLAMGCIVSTRRSTRESLWGRPGADVRAVLVEELQTAITVARRLGARHLTTVCARDPHLPDAVQRANLIEHLRYLADIADRAGATIAMEQTSVQRMPGMILQHITDLHQVVCAVDAPSVQILFDLCHCQYMDGNLVGNLKLCWDSIAAIQIADVPGRLEPGTGEINFPFVLRTIKERGYTGLIEIETYLSQPGLRGEQVLLEQLHAIDSLL